MWTNAYTLTTLGDFLQTIRQDKGITQADFAERLGISHVTLSNLEQGKSVRSETLLRAIQMLGMRLVVVPKSADVSVKERNDV